MTLLRSSMTRPDGQSKARGTARYTQDITRPGMLHGALVRSPHAAARMLSIDKTAALAMPGVAAVLIAEDLLDRCYGIITPDEPILARDAVRYVGEPVALVAAETHRAALAAADLVQVEWTSVPAAVTLEQALETGAPLVHGGDSNVASEGTIARGDVEAAFAAASVVIKTRIESQRAHQAFIEPRVSLAEVGDDGRLQVTTSSQSPYEVRKGLSDLFDLPISQIGVRVPTIGGGFGGKLHLGMAPYAAALCLATGRPVQVLCSREEEMQSPAPRENSVVEIESAVDREGRILGRRAVIHLDSGAYAYDTPAVNGIAALQACGPYDIPAVQARAATFYTNTPPTGSFRAPSGPQMAFANEAHIEEIAAQLGLDPIEVRRRNVVSDGSLGPSGQLLAHPGMSTCLERAAEVVEGWRAASTARTPGAIHGIGLACAWWGTYPGGSAATVTMTEDGGAIVQTGATEIGTGAVSTGLVALVADRLGLRFEDIRLDCANTDNAPWDFGSQGSRTLHSAGGAVLRAADRVREILAQHVAEELEAAPEDLVFADGRIEVAGAPGSGMTMAEAVATAFAVTGPVAATGCFQAQPPPAQPGCVQNLIGESFNEPTYHAHAAEVEIHPATGHLRVLRYLAVHDIGPALHPQGVRGQIEGGVVQGLGYALFEEMQIDTAGRTRNASFVDYRLPTFADIPEELEIVIVSDHPGSWGPEGVKGIGEAPVILPASAVGAAVRDALGALPLSLPMTADRIRALAATATGAPV